MIEQGLKIFRGKRVLLLQGPVGPFFWWLRKDLIAQGATVYKINFNGGDLIDFPRFAINYRGTMEAWPVWLAEKLDELKIDAVLLCGDCREIHQAAHAIAEKKGIEIGVFEEGYVRPDYVTLEQHGVNHNSKLPRNPEAFAEPPPNRRDAVPVSGAYWWYIWWGCRYFTVGGFLKWFFPHYRHHRPLHWGEMFPWYRSVGRRWLYSWKERDAQELLTTQYSKRFFLVPLQVYLDFQVTIHSEFSSVEEFIEYVMKSFAENADEDTLLVYKHHPLDRGYRDYQALIRRLSLAYGVGHRVWYIHDQHLPTLLDHSAGVVLINSTVGMSALHHRCPLNVCGNALYDMQGLTWQGSLDDFWQEGSKYPPDNALYERFRDHLIARTQINGNFFKRLNQSNYRSGLIWSFNEHTDNQQTAENNQEISASGKP